MRLEARVPTAALQAIRAPFLAMGAETLEAPIVLPLGLLLDIAGEALRERLFVVSTDGGEESCLRPDFTVPALLAHVAAGRRSGRYFYEGHAFRVAPPTSARAEEFLQIGLEVFEDGDSAGRDAEMATLAWRSAAAGGRSDLSMVLGDAGLFAAFLESLDIPTAKSVSLRRAFASPRRLAAELADGGPATARGAGGERLARVLAALETSEAEAILEEIWALAGIEPIGARPRKEIVRRLAQRSQTSAGSALAPRTRILIEKFLAISETPRAALASIAELAPSSPPVLENTLSSWDRRLGEFADQGLPMDAMVFSAAFGRAFGYYDGPLFEVRSEALGDGQPVAAGGRYDSLTARLGAPHPGSAVGCMVRPGRAWIGGAP